MKADDKERFENDKGKMEAETYSYFDKLVAKVAVLQEQMEVIGKVLKQNNLTKVEEEYDMTLNFDDEMYKNLEAGDEDEN